MNIEVLTILHPDIDWDNSCKNYRRCIDCPIGQRRIKSTVNWETCMISDENLSFKDIYKQVIREIQRYNS